MAEIEKDLRLPTWAGSWFQVAQKLECQDYYEHCATPDAPAIEVDHAYHSMVKGEMLDPQGVMEYFEGDSYTVKGRAFDEINELIPDLETLLKMRDRVYHAYHFSNTAFDPDKDPTIQLFEKLIDLQTRRK